MDFRTSQGGETTLVFDAGEELQLVDVGERIGLSLADVKHEMHLVRQANPLADFDGLLMATYPKLFRGGGLVPEKTRKQPKPDPLADLEQSIRQRLSSAHGGAVGMTSQSQQVEAMLLQALAICLLAQQMKARDA